MVDMIGFCCQENVCIIKHDIFPCWYNCKGIDLNISLQLCSGNVALGFEQTNYAPPNRRGGDILFFIAPAYSKVLYRGSTFRPFVRPSVRPSTIYVKVLTL